MNGAFIRAEYCTNPSSFASMQPHYLTTIEERPENVGPLSLDGDNAATANGLPSTVKTPRAAPRCLRRGLVKTGLVSQIVQAIRGNQEQDSRYSSSATSLSTLESTTTTTTTTTTVDGRDESANASAAAQARLVRTLICIFETGAVDRVGPLKLYHAQTYKRELSRISARNLGQVLRKTRRFNQLLNAPRRHSLDSQAMLESLNAAAPNAHPSCGHRQDNLLDSAVGMYDGSLSPPGSLPHRTPVRLRRKSSFLRAVTGNSQAYDNEQEQQQVATPIVHVTRPTSMLYSNGDQPSTDPAIVLPLSVSQTCLQQPKPVAVVSRRLVQSDVVLPKVPYTNGDRQGGLPATVSTSGDGGPFPVETAERRDQVDAGSRFVRRRNGRREKHITRFINLYNSSQGRLGEAQDDSCSLSPSCSSSLSDSSIPKAAVGLPPPSAPSAVAFVTAPSDTIYREGILYHKQPSNSGGGGSRSSHDRSWQLYWAFLIDHTLHLCPEKSMLAVSPTSVTAQKFVNFVREKATLSIDVRSCIADIAYNQLKRKSVFRCITVKQSEHLFQAVDDKDMIDWIEALQSCAKGAEQETVSPSSLALIIKRYERQSHCSSSSSVSPSVKAKKSGQSPLSTKSPLKPMAEQEQTSEVSLPPLPPPSSSQTSSQQVHHSEATLKRVRKWCKTKRFPATTAPSAAPTAITAICQLSKDEQSRPGSAVFGLQLEDCLTTGETDYVPLIVQLCVKVVEAYGLDTVGVYRIPGNTAAVNTLSASLDQGFEFVEFDDIRWRDVNVVSSLLKAFFRKLPDPLLTSNLYRHFIEANRIESHEIRLKTLRDLVRRLPKHNYETLRYLMRHLNRVVAHSVINKMEAKNLALMFGPSLVRPSGENMVAMVTHMSDQCKLVESLIVYCDWIFGEETAVEQQRVDRSSAEVGQLLDFIGNSERDLKEAKENIVRNLVNVRAIRNEHPSPRSALSVSPPCDERNIDEEIARAYRLDILNEGSISGAAVEATDEERRSQLALPPSTRELIQAAEDYKRSREEQIYTARRIFIAGGAPTESIDNKINVLAQHCRHLNINNADSLDVLSPETREKIKQFQRGHPLCSSGRGPLNFPQSSTAAPQRTDDIGLLESGGNGLLSPSDHCPLRISNSCDSLDEAHFAGGGSRSPASKSCDFPACSAILKESLAEVDDGKQQRSLLNRGRLRHVKPEFSFFRRMVTTSGDCPTASQMEEEDEQESRRAEGSSSKEKAHHHYQRRPYTIGNLLKFSRKAAAPAVPQERRRDLRRHTLGSMETEHFKSDRQLRRQMLTDRESANDNGRRQRWPSSGDEPVQMWLKGSPLRRSNPDVTSPTMPPAPPMGDRPLWVHS
uniref:Rho-GAP domain-containing protein n=1 Tax=Trichuris muris TaxID=70415 RepID=A0A5S6QIM6_TRIMR